jgi:AcrR family transcriptional regulator
MARSRSPRAHRNVLEAALKLFAEQGVDSASMDAIAAAAGVSKATIYNHWRHKDALCLEALAYLHGHDAPAVRKTGDSRTDIIAVLNHQPPAHRADLRSRLMPQFMAYAARNPDFGKAWRALVMRPGRIEISQLLRRAIAAGDLRPDLNLEASVAMLIGPMIYRHVRAATDDHLLADLAERVVDAFWRANSPRRTRSRHTQTRSKTSRPQRARP